MKKLVCKGLNQKGLLSCLKICIPELQKNKLLEEKGRSIFDFFAAVL